MNILHWLTLTAECYSTYYSKHLSISDNLVTVYLDIGNHIDSTNIGIFNIGTHIGPESIGNIGKNLYR